LGIVTLIIPSGIFDPCGIFAAGTGVASGDCPLFLGRGAAVDGLCDGGRGVCIYFNFLLNIIQK
jgi:hypothetical protein